MTSPEIVIAQKDPNVRRTLANDLQAHFSRVTETADIAELSEFLVRSRANVAVLDLELINLQEIRKLAKRFGDLAIVCTHRSPDEKTWFAAIEAGAVEFCHPRDLRSILRALRAAPLHHTAKAA